MSRRLRVVAPLLAAALLLTGCTETGQQTPNQGTESGPWDQWKNPTTEPVAFSGKTTDGSTFSSRKYLGEVVVVNFWYAECGPCRAEAGTLNSLATTYAGRAQFVGVNVSDDSATAANFERTFKSTYPSIVDQEQGARAQLAFANSRPPKAVPSTLVLDARGRVTARIVGLANKSILNQFIQDELDGVAK